MPCIRRRIAERAAFRKDAPLSLGGQGIRLRVLRSLNSVSPLNFVEKSLDAGCMRAVRH